MNPAFVCLLGMGTVFFGLICIIVICSITGAICRMSEKKTKATTPATNQPVSGEIPNRQELIAAVSAAIAEDLGEDISAIRILSVKKL